MAGLEYKSVCSSIVRVIAMVVSSLTWLSESVHLVITGKERKFEKRVAVMLSYHEEKSPRALSTTREPVGMADTYT